MQRFLNNEYDRESDDDEGVTGRLSDAAAAAHTGRTLICQIRVRPHGPLIHASGSSAYEIVCSLFPDELLALLVEEINRYYDQTVTSLGGLDNLPS